MAERDFMKLHTVLNEAGGIALLLAAHLGIAQNGCEALKNLRFDNAEIVSAQWVEAGIMPLQLALLPGQRTSW